MIRMKIKDICDLQNGRAFKPSDWGTAGVPIIRIQNLNDERAPFNYYSGKYNLAQEVDNGDLLFSWSGTPGTSFGAFLWNRGKGVLNQHIFKVIPKVEVDKTYLMYALNGNISTIISKAHGGVGLQHITKKELDEIEIQMVSISRQKKIVEILEKISLLIFLRKQQLEKLDELVKARFVEMFGEPVSNPYKFEVRSLQNMLDDGIITYHLDGNHGSDYPRNEEFVQTGIPYISANCIVNGNIDFSLAKHLTKERAKKLRKGIAQNGDVLFAHNATVGPVSILHTDEEKVILGTSLTAYRCNKKVVLPPYLKCYMQSDGFVRQYSKDMKQTTRNQVPITIQRKYLFMIPPLSLQNEFAAFVERVDQQKQTVQQSLEKLKLMKKALMQEYFG